MRRVRFLALALVGIAACGVIDGLTGAPRRGGDEPDDGGTARPAPDAGSTDDGSPDAGSTDSGPPDAGLPTSTAASWKWQGPARLDPEPSADGDTPRLAVRPDGRLYATWTGYDEAADTNAVWLATRGPGAFGWDAPRKIPAVPGAGIATYPQVAVNATGPAVVVYTAQEPEALNPTSVRAARFDDDLTVTVADIARLDHLSTSSPELNWAHAVAVDEEGRAIALWRDDDHHQYVSVSASGAVWSTPVPLDPNVTNLPLADAAASRGHALVGWTSASGTFARLSTIADGSFVAGTLHTLGTTPASRGIPHVALRGDTGLVVWKADGGGLGWDRIQNGAWRGPDVLAGASRVGDHLDLAMNAAGDAVAIWQQVPAGSTDMWEANLYAATFDGTRWSAPKLISHAGDHRMASNIDVDLNEHGDALVAWTDFDAGGTYTRLWANLLRATPGAWSGPVAIDPDSPHARQAAQPYAGRSVHVVLQPDGSGATVVWAEEESLDVSHVWENRLE